MNTELLHTYLRGDATAKQKLEVLLWIEKNSANRKEYEQLRKLYDFSTWNGDSIQLLNRKQSAIRRLFTIPLVKEVSKIAAIIIVAVGGTLFLKNLTNSGADLLTQTIEVPTGQHVNLTLSDGTKVSLNSNSKLHFPNSFDHKTRTVVLDGEGYFEVAHNADKPFHVKTSKYDVKVLGTVFNVMSYNNSDIFETSLLKGSVCVSNLKTTEHVFLKPHEKAQSTKDGLSVSQLSSEDLFLWRKGVYVFKNESMLSVFKKLEEYYQTDIIIRNSEINTTTITGKFRQKDGIDQIIRVLQKEKDFKYYNDMDNNRIYIY
ncbi:MAG: FecR domain-containing protein [Bacteroidales bacterium]|nr:FecR domain-containing protein [Bacteroidales bacterium]